MSQHGGNEPPLTARAMRRYLRMSVVARCVRCEWEGRSSDAQIAVGAYMGHHCVMSAGNIQPMPDPYQSGRVDS